MQKEQKQAITELADLLHQLNLTELEYESDGVRIKVVGERKKIAQEIVVPKKEEAPKEQKNQTTVNSPMVGVIYLSKDKASNPFVRVGDRISVGQTVCLIEAMKTFNPVKADKSGIVTKILVESGNPVEFGQPLFILE